MKHKVRRIGLAFGIALVIVVVTLGVTTADSSVNSIRSKTVRASGNDYLNCRLGVGVAQHPLTTYNYTLTRSGWYIDWTVSGQMLAGTEYFRTIRVKQDKNGSAYLPSYQITPTLDFSPNGLGQVVQANPGQLWIIGNEPDRVFYQDEALPDMYAQIYHDAYTFIKGIDPSAQIAIGGVVQPTPLRLQYLDRVLGAYRAKYGTPMPIDVWNIHIYMLREYKNEWGAEIPPGISAKVGMTYTIAQNIDINVFVELVKEMRSWMKSRGYQYTPLMVSEYGVLYPLWFLEGAGKTITDAQRFLADAVNYLNTARDASLGYAPDNYRLVQQAALYSLDDDRTFSNGFYLWGSFIFRSTPPYTLTSIGAYYNSILAALPKEIDLMPYRSATEPAALLVPHGGAISPTLIVYVANGGNSAAFVTTTVRFLDVTGGQNVLLGEVPLPPFNGCGRLREVSIPWPNLRVGAHTARIEVDPGQLIAETSEANNVMTQTIVVGAYGLYVPLVPRNFP